MKVTNAAAYSQSRTATAVIGTATPGEGNLWDLTPRHATAPQRLFLKIGADMIPSN